MGEAQALEKGNAPDGGSGSAVGGSGRREHFGKKRHERAEGKGVGKRIGALASGLEKLAGNPYPSRTF